MQKNPRIGTAGWSIPSALRTHFPEGKSLLERYSQIFNAVEINSSFYRSHKKTTYERWANTTPLDFLFAVKMPKHITHQQRLIGTDAYLDQFINEVSGLGAKLGPLLIQLPPSLKFEPKIANNFFKLLRNSFHGKVVLEPRHISWSTPEVMATLLEHHIIRVLADPAIVSIETPQLFHYYRLHGTPEIYSSPYEIAFLEQLVTQINASSWVIFDNTKFGAATQNALDLKNM
jgi:uncharacterized protein YecE (DUF72 family)